MAATVGSQLQSLRLLLQSSTVCHHGGLFCDGDSQQWSIRIGTPPIVAANQSRCEFNKDPDEHDIDGSLRYPEIKMVRHSIQHMSFVT